MLTLFYINILPFFFLFLSLFAVFDEKEMCKYLHGS